MRMDLARGRQRRRPVAHVLALALALALVASGASAVEPGDPAPAFAVPAIDGGADIRLEAYRGKVVYLDFWASWCAPCLTSLPQLDELQRELGDDGFQVVAVNVDTDPDKARRFLAKFGVAYPSATDPKGTVPSTYQISTMPTSFLIDANGVVRYVHEGFRQGDVGELRGRIRELLSVPAAPAR